MTNAYATLAAEGQRATPYLIQEVSTAAGEVTYTAEPETEPGVERDVAVDVTDAMTFTMGRMLILNTTFLTRKL